jgi:hypothetical protein
MGHLSFVLVLIEIHLVGQFRGKFVDFTEERIGLFGLKVIDTPFFIEL